MMDEQNDGNEDRMTPTIAVLGYSGAILIIFLLFWLASPVTS